MPVELSAERAEARVVPIEKIQIPAGRFRKDFGDLEELAQSIHRHGLQSPVCVTADLVLLAGERRLVACRDVLHLREVPVRVFRDVADALLFEYDENEVRKEFTYSERVAIARALSARMGDGRSDRGEEDRAEGTRRDLIVEKSGLKSGSTLSRATKVVDYGSPDLVEAMDREEIPVTLCSRIADLAKPQQKEVVRRIREGEKPRKAYQEVAGRPPENRGDAWEGDSEVEEEPAEVSVDANGVRVPLHLRDAFNNRVMADACRLLRALARQMQGVVKWDPYLRITDVQAHLRAVCALIDAARPHAVCPKCKAARAESEQCRYCRCAGFLDENSYFELAERMRVEE